MAVLGDMIEGVVVSNRLQPPHADRLRNDLWKVVAGLEVAAVPPAPSVRPTTHAA
jgi:hypothetical protein